MSNNNEEPFPTTPDPTYEELHRRYLVENIGLQVVQDLQDRKLADQFIKILKKSNHIAKISVSPTSKDSLHDLFLQEVKKKYEIQTTASKEKKDKNRPPSTKRVISFFEETLSFGAPNDYRGSAIIRFIGNLVLDGFPVPKKSPNSKQTYDSIQFSSYINKLELKKIKHLWPYDYTSKLEKGSKFFKVIISFDGKKDTGSGLKFPGMAIYQLGNQLIKSPTLGTKEKSLNIELNDFKDLWNYFEKFMKYSNNKIDTSTIGKRLFFVRRYLAGITHQSLSGLLLKEGIKATDRTLKNWEESEDTNPSWLKNNFKNIVDILRWESVFLFMPNENLWSEEVPFEIIHDWILFGDDVSKHRNTPLPEFISGFTNSEIQHKNFRISSFESWMRYYDQHPDFIQQASRTPSKEIDYFWINEWVFFFSSVEENELFNIMDILRLSYIEKKKIHEIFWLINAGSENALL